MSKPLLFLGTTTNIIRYKDAAERQGLTVAGIIDSDWYGNTDNFKGVPIIGTEVDFNDNDKLNYYKEQYDFFISVNWTTDPHHTRDKEKRQMFINLVREHKIKCISLIDPTSYLGTGTQVGEGVYVAFSAMIEPGTILKDFCQVHDFVGLAHGTIVGENTVIQRQAGLHADIGDNVYIGMWTKVFKSGLMKIGNNAIINPGLYVARDVKEGEHIKLTKDAIKVYQYGIKIE